jgi:hypothetical protein
MRHLSVIASLLALTLLLPSVAVGYLGPGMGATPPSVRSDLSPWESPDEISVVAAFNKLYSTRYDPTNFAGLRALLNDRAADIKPAWTIADIRWLQAIACESGGSPVVSLLVNGVTSVEVFRMPPWTPPSRGWLPDNPAFGRVDLVALLKAQGIDPHTATFQVIIDHTPITPDNTWRIRGLEPSHSLLAFNDNGSTLAGDRDANEPILLAIGDIEWR